MYLKRSFFWSGFVSDSDLCIYYYVRFKIVYNNVSSKTRIQRPYDRNPSTHVLVRFFFSNSLSLSLSVWAPIYPSIRLSISFYLLYTTYRTRCVVIDDRRRPVYIGTRVRRDLRPGPNYAASPNPAMPGRVRSETHLVLPIRSRRAVTCR